eukprot:6211876-Pleurochrysis_carterae.AAC.2
MDMRAARMSRIPSRQNHLPPTSIVFTLKSTPMVEMKLSVYVLSEKRRSRLDLPTPESPISSSLNRRKSAASPKTAMLAHTVPHRTRTQRPTLK